MLFVIKDYLQAKFGQRGAEMVEYAIVIACIAAIGSVFYGIEAPATNPTLKGALSVLFAKIQNAIKAALQ